MERIFERLTEVTTNAQMEAIVDRILNNGMDEAAGLVRDAVFCDYFSARMYTDAVEWAIDEGVMR